MGHATNRQQQGRGRRSPAAMICNVCFKEPRQPGSGHCKKCAETYRDQEFNRQRLQRKIDAARAEAK